MLKLFFLLMSMFHIIGSQQEYLELSDLSIYQNYVDLVNHPYTDHSFYFIPFLKRFKINNFLEFGLGVGSKVFLDLCANVTSFEMSVSPSNIDWFNRCKIMFLDAKNWNPILFECSGKLIDANIIAMNHGNPSYDSIYVSVIDSLVCKLCSETKFDCAFVDSGFLPRADLVIALFDKVPVVVAHDTSGGVEDYGWNRIQTPSNYVKITLPSPQGVTFWVHELREDMIAYLKFMQKNYKYKKLI